jgi:hypothetical protein
VAGIEGTTFHSDALAGFVLERDQQGCDPTFWNRSCHYAPLPRLLVQLLELTARIMRHPRSPAPPDIWHSYERSTKQ